MKVEAYVLVSEVGGEPCVSSKPWKCDYGKWYRLTAEVPDPVPSEEVSAVVAEVDPFLGVKP
jgi:hypothetical protein